MIRVLIFVLTVILFAGAATVLAGAGGRIEIEAFGLVFDLHSGFAFGLLAVLFALAVYATVVVKDFMALPAKLRAREAEARRARGVSALTRGLEAVAAGDAGEARRLAAIARRQLDEPSLTRLLTAQAAQLAGEEEEAHEAFSAMLNAPDTEFLGLRGLYLQAMRRGDKAAAREHAEKAFRLRPGARWAFDSVLELGLERGAWGETRAAIAIAEKNGLVASETARRGEAALLAADAYAARDSGDAKLALDEAEAAIKLAPGFAPAAALAARLQAAKGSRSKAAKILEAAFAEAPHPALVAAHGELYEGEDAETRAERLKRLADRRPAAREAKLALARRHLLLGEYEAARQVIEPLLREAATARECALMAEAVGAEEGPEASAAARRWLERAAAARHDPAPGADGDFHFTREGWARLVRDYMEHARLSPPPLEDAPPGVSEDEIRLLAAPPAPQSAERVEKAPASDDRKSDTPVPDAATNGEEDKEAEAQAARAVAAAGSVS